MNKNMHDELEDYKVYKVFRELVRLPHMISESGFVTQGVEIMCPAPQQSS